MQHYPTIAAAEKAITDAGYVRDIQRAVWTSSNKTAKVKRDAAGFYVEWS